MTEYITKEQADKLAQEAGCTSYDGELWIVDSEDLARLINHAIAQKFEVVAWSLQFKYGYNYERTGPVNAMTTFPTEEKANKYADDCAINWQGKHVPESRPAVTPLYALKGDSK